MIASVLDDALSYSGLNTDQSLFTQNLTAHAVLSSPEYNMSSYSQTNSTVSSLSVSQGQLPDTPINRFKIELASALSLISGITMVTVTSCTRFQNGY